MYFITSIRLLLFRDQPSYLLTPVFISVFQKLALRCQRLISVHQILLCPMTRRKGDSLHMKIIKTVLTSWLRLPEIKLLKYGRSYQH